MSNYGFVGAPCVVKPKHVAPLLQTNLDISASKLAEWTRLEDSGDRAVGMLSSTCSLLEGFESVTVCPCGSVADTVYKIDLLVGIAGVVYGVQVKSHAQQAQGYWDVYAGRALSYRLGKHEVKLDAPGAFWCDKRGSFESGLMYATAGWFGTGVRAGVVADLERAAQFKANPRLRDWEVTRAEALRILPEFDALVRLGVFKMVQGRYRLA